MLVVLEDSGTDFEIGDAAGERIGDRLKDKGGKRRGIRHLAGDRFADCGLAM